MKEYEYKQPRTLEDALNVFGLPNKNLSQLSEKNVKSIFRKLATENHPDRNSNDESKRLRYAEITIAWDILKKYFEENKETNRKKAEEVSLQEYIKKQINKLKEKIDENSQHIELGAAYQKLKSEIASIIYQLETDSVYYRHKNQFDNEYENVKRNIRLTLVRFKTFFYKQNYIEESEVKINLDYDTNLITFYNQLLTIKSRYSKIDQVENRLKKELEKYKSHPLYKRFEFLILVHQDNAKYNIENNNFQNIENEIQKLHQNIKSIFEKYSKLQSKITALESVVKEINDETIKEKYYSLQNEINTSTFLEGIDSRIEELERHIEEYKELELQKQKQKELEDVIVKIYQSIIMKYSEALKKYNIFREANKINQIQEELNQILQIFVEGFSKGLNLDFFIQLDGITFIDELKDNEILANVLRILNKSNIYIKIKEDSNLEQSCFFYVDEENMMLYRVNQLVTHARKITKEELEKDYTPIEELLKSSQKINEFKKIGNELVRGIYKTKTHVIFICKHQFNITINSIYDKFEKTFFYDEGKNFEDKQQVIEMIKQQVKQKVDEYKQANLQLGKNTHRM